MTRFRLPHSIGLRTVSFALIVVCACLSCAKLTEEALRRGSHRSTAELQQAIKSHIAATNHEWKPFVSTKTAHQIIASVARFCARTVEQHS
jgi:hypothetical protein